jgi:hypothetical protein
MRRIYAAGIPWIRGRYASEANWQWGDTSTAKYEVAAKTKLTSD